jgi:hypothetical protein
MAMRTALGTNSCRSASLARPGGNLTGINFFANELAATELDRVFADATPIVFGALMLPDDVAVRLVLDRAARLECDRATPRGRGQPRAAVTAVTLLSLLVLFL